MIVTRDMQFLSGVANDPSVFPYISWDGCDRIRLDGDMLGIQWDDGGFVFHRILPNVFEVHTLFYPKAKDTDRKADEALAHVFQVAEAVLTRIPDDLPHVKRFAKRHGFEPLESEESWTRKGKPVRIGYYQLTRERYKSCQPQP